MKTIKDYKYSCGHVIKRLKERHNLEIDDQFYDRMNENLQPYIGKIGYAIATDNNGDQEIHQLFIKNKIIQVVFSKSKNRITTVLPK